MKNFLYQVKINYLRIVLRNFRFFFFSLFFPIFFYILYTKAFDLTSFDKTWALDYLISMVVYSSVVSSINSAAVTLVEDREHYFELFVELSPSSKLRYYASMAVVFMTLNILSIVVIGLIAIALNHVSISIGSWLSFIVLLPLFSLPLVLLGILISRLGSANVVNVISNILMFSLAIFGGLWWPLEIMPKWLQNIGKYLPSYQISDLIKRVIHGQTFAFGELGGLVLWALLFGGLIYLFTKVVKGRELQIQ